MFFKSVNHSNHKRPLSKQSKICTTNIKLMSQKNASTSECSVSLLYS